MTKTVVPQQCGRRECIDQPARPVHDIIMNSFDEGNVSENWKKADIIPVIKEEIEEAH